MVKSKTASKLSINELWSLLDRTVFAISRLREIELSQFGVTIPQSAILRLLQSQGGSLTIQDLKRNRMRQPHSISALINRMAKDGLVKKTKESNGKKYQINIAPEGKKINQKLTETSLRIMFNSLSAKEKMELANCLMPLLEKARYLLGMSQSTPIIRSIFLPKNKRSPDKKDAKPIPDYDLWILFDQAGFALSRLREIELTQFGLTLPQSAILYALQTHEGSMTIAEMEDYTMRQPLSMFLLINRMEKSGLVSQTKDRQGKKNQIIISKQGKELYSRVTTDSNDMIFSTLSDKEQIQLAEFLDTLLERARYLLGITYVPPILKYLAHSDTRNKLPKLDF